MLRPPVERIINKSGSCPVGELHETFKIHSDAVYSDTGARQVFVIDSPNGPSLTEQHSTGSADRYCASLAVWCSLAGGHLLFRSRFFAIR